MARAVVQSISGGGVRLGRECIRAARSHAAPLHLQLRRTVWSCCSRNVQHPMRHVLCAATERTAKRTRPETIHARAAKDIPRRLWGARRIGTTTARPSRKATATVADKGTATEAESTEDGDEEEEDEQEDLETRRQRVLEERVRTIDFDRKVWPRARQFLARYSAASAALTGEDCASLTSEQLAHYSRECGIFAQLHERAQEYEQMQADLREVREILLLASKNPTPHEDADAMLFRSELEAMQERSKEMQLGIAMEMIRLVHKLGIGEMSGLAPGPGMLHSGSGSNNGKSSSNTAVMMEIRAGTGGTEAKLFVAELAEMYSQLAMRQGWRCELLSASRDEGASGMAGFRDATLKLAGEGAHALLRFEAGVHRVQRVPSTESSGRLHTSTVSVAVLPFDEDRLARVDVEVLESDIRIDTFRSQGAGGQSVNKSESAVRITHMPTGTVVTCQDERSQLQNRASAMRTLHMRLRAAKLAVAVAAETSQRRAQLGATPGERSDRIRTYNFPQSRVTDHRIPGLTVVGNISDVMLGGDSLLRILDELHAHDENAALQAIIAQAFS